jgi:hypothetical protein
MRVLLPVGVDVNDQNLLQRGALYYAFFRDLGSFSVELATYASSIKAQRLTGLRASFPPFYLGQYASNGMPIWTHVRFGAGANFAVSVDYLSRMRR